MNQNKLVSVYVNYFVREQAKVEVNISLLSDKEALEEYLFDELNAEDIFSIDFENVIPVDYDEIVSIDVIYEKLDNKYFSVPENIMKEQENDTENSVLERLSDYLNSKVIRADWTPIMNENI